MSNHDEDADEVAEKIGNGHGYKHVGKFSNPDYGEPLPVSSRDEYREHVADTLKDPNTQGFHTADGRDQYYNAETNTFVGSNPKAKDGGSAYRPDDGPEYYESLKKDDADYRERHGLAEQPSIESGGYAALQERKQALASGQGGPEGDEPSASSQMDDHWPPQPEPEKTTEAETESETDSKPKGRSR